MIRTLNLVEVVFVDKRGVSNRTYSMDGHRYAGNEIQRLTG